MRAVQQILEIAGNNSRSKAVASAIAMAVSRIVFQEVADPR
jgi:hypothetical protein